MSAQEPPTVCVVLVPASNAPAAAIEKSPSKSKVTVLVFISNLPLVIVKLPLTSKVVPLAVLTSVSSVPLIVKLL